MQDRPPHIALPSLCKMPTDMCFATALEIVCFKEKEDGVLQRQTDGAIAGFACRDGTGVPQRFSLRGLWKVWWVH